MKLFEKEPCRGLPKCQTQYYDRDKETHFDPFTDDEDQSPYNDWRGLQTGTV